MPVITVATNAILATLPQILIMQILLVPFIILEQWRPAGPRPRFGDYLLNIAISATTLWLLLPLSGLGAAGGALLRAKFGVTPLDIRLEAFQHIPVIGDALAFLLLLAISLMIHELWFYWSHRLEHKIPLLWSFHKLHHSDERANCSTWARDHVLQSLWRSLFSAFTLGFFLPVDPMAAGQMGIMVALFMALMSMFYHSNVHLRIEWLNPLLVTPQVHRIHHSVDPAHHNKNFADFLPVFDIVFGTYHRPVRDEFPQTGLGPAHPAPRGVISAQLGPLVDGLKGLFASRAKRVSRSARLP